MSISLEKPNPSQMKKSGILDHNPHKKTDMLYEPLRKILIKTDGEKAGQISVNYPGNLTTSYLTKQIYDLNDI